MWAVRASRNSARSNPLPLSACHHGCSRQPAPERNSAPRIGGKITDLPNRPAWPRRSGEEDTAQACPGSSLVRPGVGSGVPRGASECRPGSASHARQLTPAPGAIRPRGDTALAVSPPHERKQRPCVRHLAPSLPGIMPIGGRGALNPGTLRSRSSISSPLRVRENARTRGRSPGSASWRASWATSRNSRSCRIPDTS